MFQVGDCVCFENRTCTRWTPAIVIEQISPYHYRVQWYHWREGSMHAQVLGISMVYADANWQPILK